jgi:hypothetical protein
MVQLLQKLNNTQLEAFQALELEHSGPSEMATMLRMISLFKTITTDNIHQSNFQLSNTNYHLEFRLLISILERLITLLIQLNGLLEMLTEKELHHLQLMETITTTSVM